MLYEMLSVSISGLGKFINYCRKAYNTTWGEGGGVWRG